MKLQDRSILITGASQGLGKAIALACVEEGASVFLCARNGDMLKQTQKEISLRAKKSQQVLAKSADVSKPEEVHKLVEEVLRQLPNLNGLVNNAGVYGPIGLTENVDWEDWKKTIEINLFGIMLLSQAVIPVFREHSFGKIVNISGGGATSALPRFSAYAASKAAVVRFTETLAEEVKAMGIHINAISPGPLNTRLLDEVLTAGPEKVGQAFYERSLKQKKEGGVPLEKGAALCVFLLSRESDGITGRLISSVWDAWEMLPGHRTELENSDIYTLRRIVPEDRGIDLGSK